MKYRANMCADIFTKAFNEKDKWEHARALINICDPMTLGEIVEKANERHVSSGVSTGAVTPPGATGSACTASLSLETEPEPCAPCVPCRHNKNLIENCCEPNSRLSLLRVTFSGCSSVRITRDDDFTTRSGRAKVKAHIKGLTIMLYNCSLNWWQPLSHCKYH